MQQKAVETWTSGLQDCTRRAYPSFLLEQQEVLVLQAFMQALTPQWQQWHICMVAPFFLEAAAQEATFKLMVPLN